MAEIQAVIEVNGPDWLEDREPYIAALTNYYAPHAVFFEGWKSSPREEIASYEWDFGDGSDTFSGFNAAHVYETPGIYTVTLTVTSKAEPGEIPQTDMDTINITVNARDGDTYYVDSAIGDDEYDGLSQTVEGGGVGPWATATKAFTEISGAELLYSPGDQILFKRGQTFDAATDPGDSFGAYRINSNAYGVMFGAYGDGEKPLIQAVGDGGGALLANAFSFRRFNSFVDLEFDLTPPGGNPTHFFSAPGGGANYLWLRIDIKNFLQGWTHSSFSGKFVVDSSTYNSETIQFYCIAHRVALLNNTFEYSGNHLAYARCITIGVIDGNIFSRPAYGRTALRISGDDLDNMASNIWVSNNTFSGWVDPRTDGNQYAGGDAYNYSLVEFRPNTADDRFGEWLVFENNTVLNAQILMQLGAWEHVRIRNNLFTTPDPSQATKFQIGHSLEKRPLSDVQIVDNTFEYTGTVSTGHNTVMVRLRPYSGPEYEGRTTHEDTVLARNVFRTSDNAFRFLQIPDDLGDSACLTSEHNIVYWEDDTDTMFVRDTETPTYLTLADWRTLTGQDLATQICEDYNKPVPGWAISPSHALENGGIPVDYYNALPTAVETGTAQAGGPDSITLANTASAVDGYYSGKTLKITGGTGAGQAQIIDGYNGTTKVATFYLPWTTVNHVSWVEPDNTSVYEIVGGGAETDSVNLWARFEDGVWADTLQQQSGESGQFTYTPTDGTGDYHFALVSTDTVSPTPNTSVHPVGPGSAITTYYEEAHGSGEVVAQGANEGAGYVAGTQGSGEVSTNGSLDGDGHIASVGNGEVSADGSLAGKGSAGAEEPCAGSGEVSANGSLAGKGYAKYVKAEPVELGKSVMTVRIPATVEESYELQLPPIDAYPGVEFVITAYRADGYVDGTMRVVDREDAMNPVPYKSPNLTADGDYVIVKDCGGLYWVELSRRTTG